MLASHAATGRGFERSSAGRGLSGFSPTIYALVTFVPFVNLFQAPNWVPDAERGPETRFLFWNEPVGTLARFYLWVHIAFGWIITAVFAASLTGLVKKDV